MQFDQDNLDPALALLSRGMPERSRRFWETSFQRIVDAGHNRALGVALGHYLLDREKPVGVLLTIASPIDAPSPENQGVINLSSWYIEPEFRWRAPLMMRHVTRNPAFAYTSLTPIPSVTRLLEACGFKPRNCGTATIPTLHPRAAIGALGVVVDLDRMPAEVADALGPARVARMKQHAELGCVAMALRDGAQWHSLIFKPRRIRGLRGLRLIHCDSLSALDRQMGAVLRHLLTRGWLIVQTDVLPDGKRHGLFRPGGIGYRKGPGPADGIDHGNSELVYLEL
jgi:hypothetical protein